MTITLEAFGIDKLSADKRVELMELIRDSLVEQVSPGDIPESHKRLLEERMAAADADPDGGRPWRVVLAEIQAER